MSVAKGLPAGLRHKALTQTRELHEFERRVASVANDHAVKFFGPWTVTDRKTATYIVRPWEIARMDPSAGGSNAFLEKPMFAWVAIENVSVDTVMTVRPLDADNVTIDGAAFITIPAGGWCLLAPSEPGRTWLPLFSTAGGTSGIGALNKFDTTGDPLALYLFADNMLDSSGNGLDLTVSSGVEFYCDVGSQSAFYFDGATRLIADAVAELEITGDMAISAILQLDANPASGEPWVSHNGSGDLEANNVLYSIEWTAGGVPKRPVWFTEHGAGVDDSFTASGTRSFGPIHNFVHIGASRESNVITFAGNGAQFGPSSGTLAAPTDGSNGRFRIGGSASTFANVFALYCFALYDEAKSVEFFRDQYNASMGQAFGFRA